MNGRHKMTDEKSCPYHFPAHTAQRPCQYQDGQRRNHGLNPIDHPCHKFPQTHDSPRNVHCNGHNQRRKGPKCKARSGICSDSLRKRLSFKETAHIGHAQYGTDNQSHHRHNQVRHGPLPLFHPVLFFLCSRRFFPPFLFCLFHGTEIEVHNTQEKYHRNGQNRIQIIGNGPNKGIQTARLLHFRCHGHGPAGDGRNDAHRRRGSVQQVGKLLPGNLTFISDGPHHRPHGETVKTVIHKNQKSQTGGGQFGTDFVLNPFPGPLSIGVGSSRPGHHHHKGAQKDKKNNHIAILSDFSRHHVEHKSDGLQNISSRGKTVDTHPGENPQKKG